VRFAAVALVLTGCIVADEFPVDTQFMVTEDVPLHRAGPDGCLEAGDEIVERGSGPVAFAANDDWVLVPDGFLPRSAGELLLGDHFLEAGIEVGTLEIELARSVLDADGCPVPSDEGALSAGRSVSVRHRAEAPGHRGFAVVGETLEVLPLRALEIPGVERPWHASVQLVKPLDEGFVIGGGALVGPRTILTVAHLGVDAEFCWSRAPRTGEAWDAGNVAFDVESVEHHPDVDLAVVTLAADADPPYARLLDRDAADDEAFFTSRWGTLERHRFADATVYAVSAENAWCDPWPARSSLSTEDLVVGPGDSGGPAWIGDDLVGLVHGENCRGPGAPGRHVFVHLPTLRDFWE